jgi:hypothetical protein
MDKKQKEICRTIQILLWLWFGTMTSFVIVNVVNIARLETELKLVNKQLENLEKRYLILNYNLPTK